jgi:hypothetical protein
VSRLVASPNLGNVDEVYQWLVDAHEGLSERASLRLNARLILLLANHIGDPEVIQEAIDCAVSIENARTSSCT